MRMVVVVVVFSGWGPIVHHYSLHSPDVQRETGLTLFDLGGGGGIRPIVYLCLHVFYVWRRYLSTRSRMHG